MGALVALLLAQVSQSSSMNLNEQAIIVRDEGIKKGASAKTIDCVGSGITCSKDGGVMYIGISGMGTTGTMTYYVDPTGSDDAGCTALAPCASLVRVFNDLTTLHFINHAITINVMAGTYTGQPALNDVEVNAAITFTGPALTTASPTTGTATGTLTAVTLGAATVLEDSTQAWTPDNLVGIFVTIGGVTRAVAVNTATTITLASPFTANPVIGNAYTLQTPAAVFTSATSPTLTLRLVGNSGGSSSSGASISVTGISFENTAASGIACTLALSNQSMTLANSRCVGTGASSTGVSYRGGGQFGSGASVVLGGSIGLSIGNLGSGASPNPTGTINFSNMLISGGTFGLNATGAGALGSAGASGCTIQNNSNSALTGATNIGMPIRRTVTGSGVPVIRCRTTGGNSAGLKTAVSGVGNSSYSEMFLDNAYIEGCATGIDASSSLGNFVLSFPNTGALTCTATVGTCVNASGGARIHLPLTWTTAATTDILLDGTSYTAADLTTAVPTRLSNFATGSTVWQ